MSNVEFENAQAGLVSNQSLYQKRLSWMVQTVINAGLAKNSNQANYVLIGVIMLSLILCIVIMIITFNGGSEIPSTTPSYIADMEISKQPR